MPSKQAHNAERAARYARRLQKASSQGAQQNNAIGSNVEEVHKVRINMGQDNNTEGIRRKAGSGTRVEQKVSEA